MLLNAFGQVLNFPLDIAERTSVHLKAFPTKIAVIKGSTKQEFFEILHHKQRIFVWHPYDISEASRIFDAELYKDIFNMNLFTVSASPLSMIAI